jgi:hypothetical protein
MRSDSMRSDSIRSDSKRSESIRSDSMDRKGSVMPEREGPVSNF